MAKIDHVHPSGTPVVEGMESPIYPEMTGILVIRESDIIQKDRMSQDKPILLISIAAGSRGTILNAFIRSIVVPQQLLPSNKPFSI
jgi:hypothetical protein